MKKITLVSILIFAFIAGLIFVGGLVDRSNLPTQNSNLTDNKIHHFNDLNLNISQPTFKPQTATTDTFSMDEVARHNTTTDCYLVINNKVYDVSKYISYHPGGSRVIISRCGKEVSDVFSRIHSNRAWDLLKKYKVGTIPNSQSDATPQTLNAVKSALKKANPNVDVIKIIPRKNFYKAKLIFDNKLYEIHINDSGKIIKEEIEDDESNWFILKGDRDD